MRNKIAWKLTLYFAAVLLIFALVVGGTFMHFFGKHTLDLKKKEMQVRATKIAEVLQDNMSRLQNRYGGIGSSRFIRYIDNITMENVWVVDENKNVKMHREDAGALPEQHGMMHGHKRMLMRQQEDIAEPASDFDYNALSPEIKRAVEQGFTGHIHLLTRKFLAFDIYREGIGQFHTEGKAFLCCCFFEAFQHWNSILIL